jgi:6-phosphogluconolactonase/glucosamine-6-phosphate isomerase/deaminase
MTPFTYSPSHHVPFRDMAALERCRKIRREDIDKHPNPDFKIRVVKDEDIDFIWVTDMFHRIKAAADAGRSVVLILPNPCPVYRHVARLLNRFQVDCKHLYAFAMDEYANEDGVIAPETWSQGFVYAMKHNFLYELDQDLRPAETQFVGPTNANVKHYSQLIADAGGADACYTGPGWTGHLAFIEPDAPEFQAASLDEWMQMGPRIVTLSPFTLAQNSLHGSFGMSGDIALVPPKAFTIGPANVIAAKYRWDVHNLTVHGTQTSWQRLMTRLVVHGPVTPQLPTSVHQLLKTDCYISESSARDIEVDWDKGY